MEIGERIRQIRIHKGLTQTELIKGICSNTYISKIESGKAKPSYSFILKVAKVLDVAPEFLIDMNMKDAEPDVHRIYQDYIQSEKINSQDLALLKLHARENHSNSTLIKIYYVLISYYTNHSIKEAYQLVEQAKNVISLDQTTAENELSYYFNGLFKYFYLRKNYSEALFYAELHIQTLQKEEAPLREAKAYFNLAKVRTKIDHDLELARIYTKRALHIFKEEDIKSGIGNAMSELAIQYHRNGLYDEALEVLDELSLFSEEYKKDYYAPILEYNYGRVYQKLEKYDQAIEHYSTSIKYDMNSKDEEQTIYAIKCLAEISIERKNWEEANDYLKQGFTLTSLFNLPNVHIELLHLRSQIYKARFDFPSYEKEMQQAVQLAQEGKYPLLLKEISIELAEHYNAIRAYKMAAKYYQIALVKVH
ncbi:XRE family transcriptional regulator [Jeotgalibacillus sp. S-D1]|uniref:helix-turn-helix domain-containing protein n=1 Tax=Jeotgalibacillus sp. S-D1 TaxID=2552189 RepID=UPI001059B4B5|nr:helix-turn-helix transcriptional regulator [Jeotgalibacillus sp. S-D1]TDL31986.1 XRE family transcriptional regulator [Jeotgalibacillus sp. S-D1]